MFHSLTKSQKTLWQPVPLREKQAPECLQSWLKDPGSLTARLQALSQGDFRVEVLNQHWGRATVSEAKVLGLQLRERVLIREVVLYGEGTPWIYARSILPHSSLVGSLRRIRKLDNRPLGAWLFRQPSMKRGPIQFAQLQLPQTSLFKGQQAWGRRSVFYVSGKPLLVGEIFLEQFHQRLLGCESL